MLLNMAENKIIRHEQKITTTASHNITTNKTTTSAGQHFKEDTITDDTVYAINDSVATTKPKEGMKIPLLFSPLFFTYLFDRNRTLFHVKTI